MSEQFTEQQRQQLQELARQLGGQAEDLCTIWKKIKPYWPIICVAVAAIPFIGWIVSALLLVLGAAIDAYCGTAREQAPAGVAVSEDEQRQIQEAFREVFGFSLTAGAGAPPFCEAWKKVKPYWKTIVDVVRRIPEVGPYLAELLEAFGRALDKACGTAR